MHAGDTRTLTFAHGSRLPRRSQGQVQMAVRKLLARYGGEVASITTTGHSLGGALASLCAFDLVGPQPAPSCHPANM